MQICNSTIVVAMSDARASNDPQVELVTYSLGSCIAVAAYDPVMRIGGMLHYQLPDSENHVQSAERQPAMFANTGMALLLGQMVAMGAEKRRLKICLAGGARMLTGVDVFDIGRRNHTAIRKILWQQGLFIRAEAIGGTAPRHLYLHIADGAVSVKTAGQCVAL